jgi:hypothetical protein
MRKIKIHLLVIAIFAVCAAYVHKPAAPKKSKGPEMDTYAYWYTGNGRMYYMFDCSSHGWIQGLDYDCVYPAYICTFIANPLSSHSDPTGNYFYTSDVPVSGINDDGAFQLFDEELSHH